MTLVDGVLWPEIQVNPKLVTKNMAANTAVVRLRKLADPVAPNKLPDDPLPNAAPTSAPLPCCRRTSRQTPTATATCTNKISISIIPSIPRSDLPIGRSR